MAENSSTACSPPPFEKHCGCTKKGGRIRVRKPAWERGRGLGFEARRKEVVSAGASQSVTRPHFVVGPEHHVDLTLGQEAGHPGERADSRRIVRWLEALMIHNCFQLAKRMELGRCNMPGVLLGGGEMESISRTWMTKKRHLNMCCRKCLAPVHGAAAR